MFFKMHGKRQLQTKIKKVLTGGGHGLLSGGETCKIGMHVKITGATKTGVKNYAIVFRK
ncbi:MAG: hypothetical protein ACLT7B_07635 [[Ruminococcus] torques]